MNWFEFHVGDYDAATAHLSMLEDAAYGRMLRLYYRTEKPLPADPQRVCRLVRAVSKPERDAVQAVLEEFFELRDDGWHQARADAELAQYRDHEPEREARKTNEETRMKRHREERAALFKLLNENGAHAPWNTKIEELRRIAEPFKVKPATPPATPPDTQLPGPATQPATATATPATATHGNVSPLPTSHFPLPNEEEIPGVADATPLSTGEPSDRPSLTLVSPSTPLPDCPHQELIALYAKHLPAHRQPMRWDGDRAETLRVRWRECAQPTAFGDGYATKADGLAFWERYFAYVASCPKLREGIQSREGGQVRVWKPDLPWLLKRENFTKVVEGAYAP